MDNEDDETSQELDLLCEYFANVERQGPGCPELTKRVLSFINNLDKDSMIADIGCGTGSQTFVLAKNTEARITAIDLLPGFMDIFQVNKAKHGFKDQVRGIVGSMDFLPFETEELDLIWSEGAIYNIGFETGLTYWKQFLKPHGYVAVSEASWLTNDRPDEINEFWQKEYPEIDTIGNNIFKLQSAGYQLVACIVLDEKCWTDNFYTPQIPIQEDFLNEHKGNQKAVDMIESLIHEAEIYDKYKDYYGYVFYIGKKIS